MKKKYFNVYAIAALLMIVVLFSACKKSSFENNNPEVAGLMVFNLASDRTVSVGISGNALTNAPLGSNNFTGGYLSIYPGSRSIDAYDYASGDSLASTSFDFVAKKYYSAFVLGANGSYRNVIVNDNFDSLSASSGQAYVRFINAIPGSSAANVTIAAGGSNVVSNTSSFATVSEFTAIAPGDIAIAVSEGSINANRTISVEAKKVYTILISAGATTSDPAQIKFVVNGTLDEETGTNSSSSAQIVNIN